MSLDVDETTHERLAGAEASGGGGATRGLLGVPLRTAALLMAGLALAGLLAGVVLNLVLAPTWTATSTVLVQFRPADVVTLLLTGTAEDISSDDLGDVAGLVGSDEILDLVSKQLPDAPSAADLAQVVSATAVASSHLVTVQATADTEAGAVRIAEATTSVLATQQQAEVTKATTDLPSGELSTRGAVVAGRVVPVRVLGGASATRTSPSLRTPLALAVVGFALGGLAVIGLGLRGRDLRPGRS